MALNRLPDPPSEYSKDFMSRLINQINLHLRDIQNPGHVQGTTVNVTQLPTSAAGLRTGDVWRDAGAANVLKIVP